MKNIRILPLGDRSLSVEFSSEISDSVNRRIHAFNVALKNNRIDGLVETVPSYRSILIFYQPEQIRYDALVHRLQPLLEESESLPLPPSTVVEIPVAYGGNYGPDLEIVAKNNHLTQEEVIRIHSSGDYLIYMLGYLPGFPYLGGMDHRIVAPRRSVSRSDIPGGSVGISGHQTGIYPIQSPGSWQLIGRTPVRLYDVARITPILLDAGNHIKFTPITHHEFNSIAQAVSCGQYKVRRYQKEE